MNARRTRFRLLPILIVACLLVIPAEVGSQCMVTNTMSFPTNLPATAFVTKTLSAAASCRTTAMNASSCFPGATFFNQTQLNAVAMSGTVNPYCNWSCTCGTGAAPHVTIDTTDGLPVELMDFGIASWEPAGGADESGDDAGDARVESR